MDVACHWITTIASMADQPCLPARPPSGGPISSSTAPAPAPRGELPDTVAGDGNPFGTQQLALQLHAAAEAAETSSGRDHPVTRHSSRLALPHDVSDRPAGPRAACRRRDVAIGGNLSWWDAAHSRQNPGAESRNRRHGSRTGSAIRRPRAVPLRPLRRSWGPER